MLSRTGFLFMKEWLKQGQISILEGEVEAGVLQTFQSGSEGCQQPVSRLQHGMVHGDVKPFNVVMDQTDEGWRWRYIDYSGLSYTNHYLDPDLLSEGSSYYRHNKADGLSDLFALLLTVVEILLEIPPCCQALPPNFC